MHPLQPAGGAKKAAPKAGASKPADDLPDLGDEAEVPETVDIVELRFVNARIPYLIRVL